MKLFYEIEKRLGINSVRKPNFGSLSLIYNNLSQKLTWNKIKKKKLVYLFLAACYLIMIVYYSIELDEEA